ncbi:copper transport protein [Devosia lucknowensis]|uniref:Copper transport protein n=1 Tax=Devosia lucknowensis TaxID=1096929 RepID=A0A1Y6GA85_9HYPH|nr:CopD family protein [Devosia lucknowensis]SMQ85628.1 copper transport protein [Devosia lucknowensis]
MPAITARFVVPLMILLLMLAQDMPALAHAQLLSTEPAANAVLGTAPETLALIFNEPVTPLAMTLIGPDGASTDLTAAAAGGEILSVHLPSAPGRGTHVLSWRVVSVDAHPVAGSLVFSVGAITGAAADIPEAPPATAVLLWAGKAILFAALALGLGASVFQLLAPLPPAARRFARAASLFGIVGAPVSLGLHGADALGLGPQAILAAPAWSTGFATTYGPTVLMLVVAFALGLASLYRFRPLALAGWALAAVALAVSGHAGAADPQWLTRPAVALHIAGFLFWAGALLPLLAALRQTTPEAGRALARFSRLAPYAVAAILLSGLVLASVQMGAPGPAWLAPYGLILAAKLSLVAVLLAIALFNRLRLTTPTLAGDTAARRHLRRAIVCEIVLVLAIVALAAGWRFTPPPRAIAAAEAAQAALAVPGYAHAMNDAVMADIVVTPGRAGPVTIDIALTDIAGAPVTPLSVDLTLSAPALGIEPIRQAATPDDGLWRIEGQAIPLAGLWDLVLDIRLDRFTLARIGTELDLN